MTTLVVPLTIDGLLLERDMSGTLGPFADFSRLPWSVPPARAGAVGHDENPDIPFTSQNALVRPLSDETGRLERGIHLHWALPEPLTVARHPRKSDGTPDQTRSDFPDVPNRWLVTRYANTGDPRSWIIESDYLWPEGTDWAPGRVTYPVAARGDDGLIDPTKQPYRYLGRAYEIGHKPAPLAGEGYLKKLIAPGYGEMAFNAVYPNCRNIFGFHDPLDDLTTKLTKKDLNGSSYRIWGWYSDAARDDVCRRATSGFPDALDELGWILPDGIDRPDRLLCSGNFRLSVNGADGDGPPEPADINVVVANTGTEALSAHLARELFARHSDEFSQQMPGVETDLSGLGVRLEHQLEAFHLEETLKSQRLDLEAKFNEARHTKTFHSVPSGRDWVLVPNTAKGEAPIGADARLPKGQSQTPEAGDLPKSIAQDLARLNDLQTRVDRLKESIDGQRAQIFSQWHKYITCCYHPDDTAYPAIDDVRRHITDLTARLDQDFAQLETADRDKTGQPIGLRDQLAVAIGTLTTALSTLAQIGATARGLRAADQDNENPVPKTLKPHLISLLRDICDAFPSLAHEIRGTNPNAIVENLVGLPDLKLVPTPATPYWQPNDPVVLLAGKGSKRSDRHSKIKGHDCKIRDWLNADLNAAKTATNERMAALLTTHKDVSGRFLFPERISGGNPWHPILLEWDVAVETQSGAHVSDHGPFRQTCFKDNYQLASDQAEALRAKEIAPTQTDTSRIGGRSVLSGHAVSLLKHRIRAFLAASAAVFIADLRSLDPKKHPVEASIVADVDAKLERERDVENGDPDQTLIYAIMGQNRAHFSEWSLKNSMSHIANSYFETPYLGRADESDAETTRGQALENLDADVDPVAYVRNHVGDVLAWINEHEPDAATGFPAEALALYAYEMLGEIQGSVQTQALGGFNQGLLMHEQVLQFDPVDPLGFAETRAFTEHLVRGAVQGQTQSAPVPHADFHPLRMGTMKIVRLRLVDSFGRVVHLDPNFKTTHQLDAPKDQRIELLPRIAQPARLNAHWKSADAPEQPSNTHPASSPLCGWVMADNFNGGLAVFDADGINLGGLASDGRWRVAPGRSAPAFAGAISNRALGNLVSWLEAKGTTKGFTNDFVTLTNRALENIDPEGFQSHQLRALTSGRPMALVRVSVGIDLKGAPAQSQSWEAFQQELAGHGANTHQFQNVDVPIRLGEHGQLNDGLVGFWAQAPTAENASENPIRMPLGDVVEGQSKDAAQALKRIGGEGSVIWRAIAQQSDCLALIDPRGGLHVTTGLLPTRKLQLPHAQFAAAMGKLELPLRVGPLITSPARTEIPFPSDPQMVASWIQRESAEWTYLSSDGAAPSDLQRAKTEAISGPRSEIREGWLTLSERTDPTKGEADV